MENILDITSVALRGDTLSQLSAQMRETQSATRRGIEQAVPASVAALASHASSEQRAEELLGAFRGGTYPHVDASQVAQVTADPDATSRLAQSSKGFLSRIFGNRLNGTVEAIAGQSGLSRNSASTLLGLAAPLVLGAVGKEAQTRNLDARGLSRFLADQGRRATSQLPGPLSSAIAGTEGGTGEIRERVSEAGQRVRATGSEAVHRVRGREAGAELGHPRQSHKGLWWALLGIGLLALLALLMFGRRGAQDTTAPGTDTEMRQAMPGDQEAQPRAEPRPEGNQQQTAPAQGAQSATVLSASTGAAALGQFLSGTDPVPRRFELQGVEFPTGQAALPANPMLDQVASTLKENESARVRLEGFADNTGPAELNQQLSQARAQSVKDYLVDKGVPADRIQAVGKGTERPAGGQGAQAGADNRRVELVVVSR